MYQPPHFVEERLEVQHGLIQTYPLGLLITAGAGGLMANPIPFFLIPSASAPGGDRLDVVALACTHFPLLAAELAAASPRPVAFVDGGAGIARRVAHLLGGAGHGAPVPGRAVFTRADAHVDALAGALKSFGLLTTEIL